MSVEKQKERRTHALVILSEPSKPQIEVEEKKPVINRPENVMLTRISASSQLQYEKEILGHAVWLMASATALLLLYIAIISLP